MVGWLKKNDGFNFSANINIKILDLFLTVGGTDLTNCFFFFLITGYHNGALFPCVFQSLSSPQDLAISHACQSRYVQSQYHTIKVAQASKTDGGGKQNIYFLLVIESQLINLLTFKIIQTIICVIK